MKILTVLAHPEPRSFCGAIHETAGRELTAFGHAVRSVDLYAAGFDPVGDRRDFTHETDPAFFKYQKEQLAASMNDGFTSVIDEQMASLQWCELAIFCFPLWWFGMPAILKGWFDRVLAMGFAYGHGRWFDTAPLAGRRAILAITAGAPRERYTEGAIFGDIERVLYPIHVGILNLTGFAVHRPFLAWSPARLGAEGRADVLESWRQRLRGMASEVPLPMHRVSDYPDPFAGRPDAYKL